MGGHLQLMNKTHVVNKVLEELKSANEEEFSQNFSEIFDAEAELNRAAIFGVDDEEYVSLGEEVYKECSIALFGKELLEG